MAQHLWRRALWQKKPRIIVEGEQHYWVHVIIDRFTDRVIDRQLEVVNE